MEGYECIDLGIVKDTIEGLKQNILEAVNRCDIVITSGGVSMGDADYVKTLLQELGTVSHSFNHSITSINLSLHQLIVCLIVE